MAADRATAFGEQQRLSVVDRFGIWLSARAIRRHVDVRGKRVADVGCGYEARLLRTVADDLESAVALDLSLAPAVKTDERITAIEGHLPDALQQFDAGFFDVLLCISVLEHLWDPGTTLAEFHRLLAPGGTCVVNVPTWRGKRLLEFSAFRLGLSPREEMNDHKMYYDPRDLWPLVVSAGFTPDSVKCRTHKFGLNTLAICRKPEEE